MTDIKPNMTPHSIPVRGKNSFRGKTLPKDEKIAFKWFRKSAKQGNALAQKALKTVLRK